MSALQSSTSSKSNNISSFDENRWVINIRRTLEEELEDDAQLPVSIFNVPKPLRSAHPDSYTPQEVSLGPYHHWRPELYEMERYKLASAKQAQKQLQCLKFEDIVHQLVKLEAWIRACYHKYLDLSGETLAWMLAVDASFLLEFLQVYTMHDGKTLTRVSSRMLHLVDYAGRKSAHNAILRDMIMLENQIPLFVLRKILEFQFPSLELADEMLMSMLTGFCKELSPFKLMEVFPNINVSKHAHILDLLYEILVPKIINESDEQIEAEDQKDETQSRGSGAAEYSYVRRLLNVVLTLIFKVQRGPLRLIKFVLKLPWTIISNLPGFTILRQPVDYLFFSQNKEEVKPENIGGTINKPPLVEEIDIPSVSELFKSGVCFSPTTGNISSISFDVNTVTLYLPTISLDVNSEVILRNLVAYEASNASGPLVFARYTELMNGIIDTEEDFKLLRQKGIILNRLKKDAEVADLWNGMNKSIRLTKVPFLDKLIEDVNKYYKSRWNVRLRSFVKQNVYGSWRFLTLLAAILLLILMTLQAFCSVYSCSRIFRINTTSS
ncbi:hypothetical protein SLE2022_381140 [Rubroshorea leprosula]